MTSEAHSDDDQKRRKWNPVMDCYLIKLMLEQRTQGNRIDGQFTKRAWSQMTKQFNAKFEVHMDKDHLRNRVKAFKKQYDSIKRLLSQSGFGWDGVRQMIIADDNVWDEYIKVCDLFNQVICILHDKYGPKECKLLTHYICRCTPT